MTPDDPSMLHGQSEHVLDDEITPHETSPMRSLRDAKNSDGSPRFYPAGQHPATAQMRAQYAKLQELHDRHPTDESTQALAYIERKLAEFDAGEEAAKLDWLARYSE